LFLRLEAGLKKRSGTLRLTLLLIQQPTLNGESRSFEISVRNKKNKEIEIEIEDQVPLSRIQEIEVEISDLSDGIHQKDSGLITWNLKVPPSETRKWKLGYTVKYPKDKVISPL
jgi:hypothetical protein